MSFRVLDPAIRLKIDDLANSQGVILDDKVL